MSVADFQSAFMDDAAAKDFPKWEDEEVSSYWLMGSGYPVTILMFSYLLFVTRVGPKMMANRLPFDLKHTLMVYNFIQVAYNIWFLYLIFTEPNFLSYMMEESCHPQIPSRSNTLRKFAIRATWLWLMSKVSDLLDTVFFVLRKKQSQVSFLHLYHHTQMVVIVWLYMKYVRGEQGIMIGIINSSVHVVMYSYYFLAALGPSVQRYLWWKKYITWLQLFQFFLLSVFFTTLLVSCQVPPIQTVYNMHAIFQGIVFTGLFVNFYFKSYKKPAKKTSNLMAENNIKSGKAASK